MRAKTLIAIPVGLLVTLLLTGPAGAGEHGSDHQPASPTASAPAPAAGAESVLTGLTQLQAGYLLSCARASNGQARCWGDNAHGELGVGDNDTHPYAVTVRNAGNTGPLTHVIQVATGDYHACALLTNHEVRCWGYNSDGQLGNDDGGNDADLPTAVVNAGDTGHLVNVQAISAESDGTCALLLDHHVRCWGDNDYGQLGNDDAPDDADRPVTVRRVGGGGALTQVTQIEMGYDNNCARLSNGQARCWGYGTYGVLGNGGTTNSGTPVMVRNPAGTGPLTNVTQISIGGYDACARLSNGQARCWGSNIAGEVGDGTTTERHRPVVVRNISGDGPLVGVAEIYAGTYHTCARLTNGQARCWGETQYGDVGDATPIGNASVIRMLPRVVKLSNDTALTGVVQLHANSYHTCALLDTGQARCWGYNGGGQLGDGGVTDRPVAVRVQV